MLDAMAVTITGFQARPDSQEGRRVADDRSEDDALIACSLEGDQVAMERLVTKYREAAYWGAYDVLHDHHAARDISQEAFIRVFRSLKRFELGRSFGVWLRRIVTNLCIDQLRRSRRSEQISLESQAEPRSRVSDPSARMEEQERRDAVHEVLDTMPPKYRVALTLRDIQGLSCEEIADQLGVPRPTVRWRLHRARNIFKEKWERKAKELGEY